MYVDVKELPDCVRSALKSVDFNLRDISVEPRETYSVGSGGSAGRKSFCIVLNALTGESKTIFGSWGGANMFNPGNQVDMDIGVYPIPLDGIVIQGSIGDVTYASISVNPGNVSKLLPVPEELTEKERKILLAMSYKSGYRKAELDRISATDADVVSLIDRGFIEQNKVGRRLTIKGKNNKAKY